MMVMKKYYIITLLTLLSLNLWSHENSENSNESQQSLFESPISLSPTSAMFNKYAAQQPSLAMGAINITIPIYELKVNEYSLPFNLQYITSGIKVGEPSFPIGYGWLLAPGLRITRVIRGRNDGSKMLPMQIKSAAEVENLTEDARFYYLRSVMKRTEDQENVNYLNNIDTQYDIFTIHLPSGSTNFIIRNETILTSNSKLSVKILHSDNVNNYNGFEVIDEFGVIYHFGTVNTDRKLEYVEFEEGYNNSIFTGWMLRKIVLPISKAEINFKWKMMTVKNGVDGEQIVAFKRKGDKIDNSVEPIWSNAPQNRLAILDEINFPLGKMHFKHDNGVIKKIEVESDLEVDVNHIEFLRDEKQDNTLLSGVKFSSGEKYRFSYNPNRIVNSPLTKDYWGYYKKTDNVQSTTIPKLGEHSRWMNLVVSGNDRSPNEVDMQASMLTRIDYPTGGFTEYEYEAHRFKEPKPIYFKKMPELTFGRGLRVKKMRTQADKNSSVQIKTYEYGNGIISIPHHSTYDTFMDSYERHIYDEFHQQINPLLVDGFANYYEIINIHANSLENRLYLTAPPVQYPFVREYIYIENEYVDSRIKNEYTFQTMPPDGLGTFRDESLGDRCWEQLYVRRLQNVFRSGPKLIKEVNYKSEKENNKISELVARSTTYSYSTTSKYHEGNIKDLYVTRVIIPSGISWADFLSPLGMCNWAYGTWFIPNCERVRGRNQNEYYEYADCEISTLYEGSYTQTDTLYSSKGNVVYTTKYVLDNGLLMSKEVDSSLENKKHKENYSYLRNTAYRTKEEYSYGQNKTRKIIDYSTESLYPRGVSLFQNDEYVNQVHYNKHDPYGNITEVSQNGITTNYLWAYKGQYPIAEIKNATYANIEIAAKSAFSISGINLLSDKTKITEAELRSFRNHTALKGALVTTYTYIPLIGMTSSTASNGITTYYTYNKANKLEHIKDNNNNILQKYIYNYHDEKPNMPFSNIHLTIQAEDLYNLNQNSCGNTTFSVSKIGGSDSYYYNWVLKDSKGNTVATFNNDKTAKFTTNLLSKGRGMMIISCTIVDTELNVTKEFTKNIQVKAPIIFENITWKQNVNATAKIMIGDTRSQIVKFRHDVGSGHNGGEVVYTFRQAGEAPIVKVMGNSTQRFTIELQPGITTVEMTVQNGSNTGYQTPRLVIEGVDSILTYSNCLGWIGDSLIFNYIL